MPIYFLKNECILCNKDQALVMRNFKTSFKISKMKHILLVGLVLLFSCTKSKSTDAALPEAKERDTVKEKTELQKLLVLNTQWKLKGSGIDFLGPKCTEGERLTFLDSVVIHMNCVEGEWKQIKLPWSMHDNGKAFGLKIDKDYYDVSFDSDTLILFSITEDKGQRTVKKKFFIEK